MSQPTADATSHRDSKGRFTKGNPGGPGNPYARRCAELRQLFHEAVSKQELYALIKNVYARACEGDMGAVRVLLAYAVGTPEKAPNPDTLDSHEWQTIQEQHCSPDEISTIVRLISKELVCDLAEAILPLREQQAKQWMLESLNHDTPEEKRHTKEKTKPGKESHSKNAAADTPETIAIPIQNARTRQAPATNGTSGRKLAMIGYGKSVPSGSKSTKPRQQTDGNGRAKPRPTGYNKDAHVSTSPIS